MLRILLSIVVAWTLFLITTAACAQNDSFSGNDIAERLVRLESRIDSEIGRVNGRLDAMDAKLDTLLQQRQETVSPPSNFYRSTVEYSASPVMQQAVPVYSVGAFGVKQGGVTRRWIPFQPIRNVGRLFGVRSYSARGVVSPVNSIYAIGG